MTRSTWILTGVLGFTFVITTIYYSTGLAVIIMVIQGDLVENPGLPLAERFAVASENLLSVSMAAMWTGGVNGLLVSATGRLPLYCFTLHVPVHLRRRDRGVESMGSVARATQGCSVSCIYSVHQFWCVFLFRKVCSLMNICFHTSHFHSVLHSTHLGGCEP